MLNAQLIFPNCKAWRKRLTCLIKKKMFFFCFCFCFCFCLFVVVVFFFFCFFVLFLFVLIDFLGWFFFLFFFFFISHKECEKVLKGIFFRSTHSWGVCQNKSHHIWSVLGSKLPSYPFHSLASRLLIILKSLNTNRIQVQAQLSHTRPI